MTPLALVLSFPFLFASVAEMLALAAPFPPATLGARFKRPFVLSVGNVIFAPVGKLFFSILVGHLFRGRHALDVTPLQGFKRCHRSSPILSSHSW